MKKKSNVGLIVSVVAISSAVTFILTSFFTLQIFNQKVENVNSLSKEYTELKELSDYVSEKYYSDVDDDSIKDAILKGYVNGLGDKYSKYLTAEEYDEFIATEKGNSTGIGITVSQTEDGYIKVESIAEEGPSASANIQIGDIIVSVNGDDVKELGYSEAIENIKGDENTKVRITIMRDNNRYDVSITRKTYEVKTVTYQMIDDNIGYIKISAFRTATINQFKSAFQELENLGANRYIFDVRDDGGGLLSALQEILDPLLPEGDIAQSTKKDGTVETIITSDADCVDYPMVVLVNESTASAAELFSCSLRDYADAELIGVQTYGKGVIQETAKLSNGGAITLTTATYKTLVSDCYNEIGLVPDEVVESEDGDDITSVDKNKDAQLKKAIEVISNK